MGRTTEEFMGVLIEPSEQVWKEGSLNLFQFIYPPKPHGSVNPLLTYFVVAHSLEEAHRIFYAAIRTNYEEDDSDLALEEFDEVKNYFRVLDISKPGVPLAGLVIY